MQKNAIVTGVTGQIGSYLTELLLEKNYRVYGMKRRTSSNGLGSISHLEGIKDLEIIEGDLLDLPSLAKLCKLAKPNEFYNLAAQSAVGTSFDQPVYTAQATGLAVLNCLEAIRESGFHTRFYQSSTSEMFGGQSGELKMNEQSPFHPRSPYGVAKLFGHWITVNYREAYKMFNCCGILFNNESPRRGPYFVTRKITQGIAAIKSNKQKKLALGNLEAKRDWGHSRDFVRGIYAMLNHHTPDDYVLATGETHSVKEFCEVAFKYAGLGNYKDYIVIDPQFYRPAEVDVLIGDYSKASSTLDWQPRISFVQLVQEMVDADS